MAAEILDFTMDPRMLLDIIERQAGTVEKAVLEATMNAAEAGSSRFTIDFTDDGKNKRLVMTDNGRGIPTRHELEEHFRKFGTPHESAEQKRWAQFRMGRGQCFAQGKNVWRTCGWVMETDIRDDVKANRLPRFALTTAAEEFKGCRIEIDLYPDKFYGTVEALKDRIREQIEFVDMDVLFNGEKINRAPATLNWTIEDDDAWYLFGVGQDLIIYNMGMRCQKIPASHAGAVGVIVSKAQLKVNFARNEVMSDCPIMRRINGIIKENRIKKTRKESRRLDREERIAALFDLRDGDQDYEDLKSIGLFFTTSGRSLTFRDILNTRTPWTFGRAGDVICDKLMQAGQALCIDEKSMTELNYSGEPRGFFRWLTRTCYGAPDWTKVEGLYRSVTALKGCFNENATLLPREKWTKKERRLIRVLESFNCWDSRALCIGIGPAYNGWTDGESYIAIERDFVNHSDFTQLFGMLAHELAHTTSSIGTHVHGEEFYRAFHNIVRYGSVNPSSYGVSPFCYLSTFAERMKRALHEERSDEATQKETKAKARVNKALGVSQSPGRIAADRKVTSTPKHKRKRMGFGKRRIPAGAE